MNLKESVSKKHLRKLLSTLLNYRLYDALQTKRIKQFFFFYNSDIDIFILKNCKIKCSLWKRIKRITFEFQKFEKYPCYSKSSQCNLWQPYSPRQPSLKRLAPSASFALKVLVGLHFPATAKKLAKALRYQLVFKKHVNQMWRTHWIHLSKE